MPFRVYIPASTFALLAVDFLLIAGAFTGAIYLSSTEDPATYLLYDSGYIAVLIVTACMIAGMYFHNLYSQVYIRSRVLLLEQLCIVAGVAFILEGLVSIIAADLRIALGVMLPGSVFSIGAIYAWRLFFSARSLEVLGRDRLLLIGDNAVLADLSDYIERHPTSGLMVAGRLREVDVSGLGAAGRFQELVADANAHRVIVGAKGGREFADELLELCFGGSPIESDAAAHERVCGRVFAGEVDPLRLIASEEFSARQNAFFYQSIFNTILSSVALIIGLPIFMLGAAAVKLSSQGPVLERKMRAGLDGAAFGMLRFRPAAEGSRAATIVRVFHLNAFLQLVNVVKGEMSLVGPRPEPQEFIAALAQEIPFYPHRQSVRPGVTGWAQIKGLPAVEDASAKLEYDLYYAKNLSISLDVLILVLAAKTALLRTFKPNER